MDMRQSGDHSNNVQVVGSGNTVTVEAPPAPPPDHVQLTVMDRTVRTYDKEVLIHDRRLGYLKLAAGGIAGTIALLADAISVSGHFRFSLFWFVPVGLLIGLMLATPHFRSGRIIRALRESAPGSASWIGGNALVEESEDGHVCEYSRGAPCIYPHCTGTIILTPSPEREKSRLGKDFVGICSLAGRDHSYRLDYIWNAYPERFDWRKPDPDDKR